MRYHHVRTMPDRKSTLLVRGADGKKNVRRLLLEVSYTQAFLDAQKDMGSPTVPITRRPRESLVRARKLLRHTRST